MAFSEVGEHAPQNGSHAVGMFHQVVSLHHLDIGNGSRQRDGVGVIRQPALVNSIFEDVGDLLAHGHCPQRGIGRSKAFGHRHQIRHDLPMIHGKPATGAAKAAHHLIGDEQNPVAIAQGPHALQVACRGDNDAIGASDRFEQYGGDRLRTFVLDDLLQVVNIVLGEIRLGDFRIRAVKGGAVAVGIQEMHHTGHQDRFPGQAARIAGERHGTGGCAVIGAVACQDFVATGISPGQFYGVLVGIRAPQRIQKAIERSGCDLAQ